MPMTVLWSSVGHGLDQRENRNMHSLSASKIDQLTSDSRAEPFIVQ